MWRTFPTLHASRAKALSCEKDGMVMVFGVFWILFLLYEGPATHILQAPRWVPAFNKANGLRGNKWRQNTLQFCVFIYLALLNNTKGQQTKTEWSITYVFLCVYFFHFMQFLQLSFIRHFLCKHAKFIELAQFVDLPLHSQAWSSSQELRWCAHLVTHRDISHSPATTYDKKLIYLKSKISFSTCTQ